MGNAKPLLRGSIAKQPDQIAALIEDIGALGADEVTVALDILGGAATLLSAMIVEAGFRLLYLPGLSVNRARRILPSRLG